MMKRAWVLLAIPAVAACSSGDRAPDRSYQAPVVEPAKSGGPTIRYGVERTGLEFQVDRGTRPGDVLLGGKVAVQRVTADSSQGLLQADIQVKSLAPEPLHALYRIIFYDDKDQPVGSVFSEWKPLAISMPCGTASLHATCSQRSAVYFVLEAWQSGKAQAKPDAQK